MSVLLRSAFTLTLAGAIAGLWVPLEAQEVAGPRPRSPASQGQSRMPPAADTDDPYGAPPLMAPENPPNEDVTEPPTPNGMPSDSSTSDREATSDSVILPQPAIPTSPAPVPDLLRFEEDLAPTPFLDTAEARREQAEELPERTDIPNLLPSPDSLPALSIIPAFQTDSMTLAFGLRYEALHDDNILLVNKSRQGDFEHILSPRLALSLGDAGMGATGLENAALGNAITQKPNFLELDYDPQALFFQHYDQYNAFEQQLNLNAQYALTRTILRESLDYNHSSDPDRELQGRTARDYVSNETDLTYRASERFTYELDGTALVRNYQQGINSDEGRLRFWTKYVATPDWTVSLGAAGGALLPEEGASQVFQQAWLATQNQIGSDLNVYMSVGGDFREPEDTGEVRSTPVFNAIIRYEPSTETQLEISAIRQIFSSSDVVDQDYVATRISIKATQRLWQTYKVGVDLGYENADYFQVGTPQRQSGTQAASPRSDNYPTAKVEFSYARFEDLEAGIFYEVRRNFSSQSDLSFSNQQIGLQFRIGL